MKNQDSQKGMKKDQKRNTKYSKILQKHDAFPFLLEKKVLSLENEMEIKILAVMSHCMLIFQVLGSLPGRRGDSDSWQPAVDWASHLDFCMDYSKAWSCDPIWSQAEAHGGSFLCFFVSFFFGNPYLWWEAGLCNAKEVSEGTMLANRCQWVIWVLHSHPWTKLPEKTALI